MNWPAVKRYIGERGGPSQRVTAALVRSRYELIAAAQGNRWKRGQAFALPPVETYISITNGRLWQEFVHAKFA
jgi:hypothetical protein